MKSILFVDDAKTPEMFGLSEDAVDWAKNSKEALEMFRKKYHEIIYLDHDLGSDSLDGYQILSEIVNIQIPERVYSITSNPVGVRKFEWLCWEKDIEFEHIFGMINKYQMRDDERDINS